MQKSCLIRFVTEKKELLIMLFTNTFTLACGIKGTEIMTALGDSSALILKIVSHPIFLIWM